MNCIILAAGLGSRLKKLTRNKPKAMIEVNGEILLDVQIKAAISLGIKKIYIIAGYKSDVILNHVLNAYDKNVRVINNFDFSKTNSAFSWLLGSPYICNEPCLHFNCDILFSENAIQSLYEEFQKDKRSIIACRNDIILDDKMEQIVVDDNNIIRCCINKYNGQLSGKAFGMCLFAPKENKEHLKILINEINNGHLEENFFKAIRVNCSNSVYKALWLNNENLAEFNYTSDLEQNNIIRGSCI